jgi:hypothetical protein
MRTYAWLALTISLSGCNKDRASAKADEPTPAQTKPAETQPAAQPPDAAGPAAAPTHAESMARGKVLLDKMCACKDLECVHPLLADYEAWNKEAGPFSGELDADGKAAEKLSNDIMSCAEKAQAH